MPKTYTTEELFGTEEKKTYTTEELFGKPERKKTYTSKEVFGENHYEDIFDRVTEPEPEKPNFWDHAKNPIPLISQNYPEAEDSPPPIRPDVTPDKEGLFQEIYNEPAPSAAPSPDSSPESLAGDPRDSLSFVQRAFTSPASEAITGTADFGKKMKESFKRGKISSELDQISYLAASGKLDFDTEVRPLIEAQQKIEQADPIKGKNFISNTLYQVASILPAMREGIVEGLGTGGAAGLAGAMINPAVGLAMGAAGQTVGSFSYWSRQGTGAVYSRMKMRKTVTKARIPDQYIDGILIKGSEKGEIRDDPIPDSIAIPTSHITGVIYGAIELAQVKDLIPGTRKSVEKFMDKIIKPTIADSVLKSVMRITAKFGMVWGKEVAEEAAQGAVNKAAEDVSAKLSGKIDDSAIKIIQSSIVTGAKEGYEAMPALFVLMGGNLAAAPSEFKAIEAEKKKVRTAVADQVVRSADIYSPEDGIANGLDKETMRFLKYETENNTKFYFGEGEGLDQSTINILQGKDKKKGKPGEPTGPIETEVGGKIEGEHLKELEEELPKVEEEVEDFGKGKGNKPAEIQEPITEEDIKDLTDIESMSSSWKAGGTLVSGDSQKSTKRKIREPSSFPAELSDIGLTHKHMNTVFNNILRKKKSLTEKQQQTKNFLLKWYRDIVKGADYANEGIVESEAEEVIQEVDKDTPIIKQDLWEEQEEGFGVPEGLKEELEEAPEVKEEVKEKPTEKKAWEKTKDEMLVGQGYKTVHSTRQEYKDKRARIFFDHINAIKQALEEGKVIPPEVLKDYPELKVEKPPLEEEAKKYKTAEEFVKNISTLPTDFLRDPKNVSSEFGKAIRTRQDLVGYRTLLEDKKEAPKGIWENFVKDIKKRGIQHPIELYIEKDGSITIVEGTHRLLAAEEIGIKNVPVDIRGNISDKGKLADIWNKAQEKPLAEEEAKKPTVETDPARIQEIKNSIAEGELILKSGKKVNGEKMSPEEIEAVQKSVDNAKAKIGETKIDLKQLGEDLGDALPGVGLSIEDVSRSKKREAARKRIVDQYLPALMAESKRIGMSLEAYLKEFTDYTEDQINYMVNVAQPPVEEPEGEGRRKVHGLSKNVMTQAVEEALVQELGDLPTYRTRNMEEAADRAVAFMSKNPDLALKIALGEAQEQGNVRASELYTAFRVKAIAEADLDMIEKLAFSKTAISLATELGQRVKAYDARLSFDPVKTIQEIAKEREEIAKQKPSAEKEREIARLRKSLEDVESKLKDVESKLDAVQKERFKHKTKEFGSENKVFTRGRMEEARARLKSKLSGLHSGIDPTAVAELTEIGGFYFEGGLIEFGEWSKALVEEFGENIRPALKGIWKKVKKEVGTTEKKTVMERISKRLAEGEEITKLRSLVQQLAENAIESGQTDRHGVVRWVMDILNEDFLDLTERETADLISGYGRYSQLDSNEIKAILRDIKGQLQQVSKLEDMQEGRAPLKTGVERRTPSDEERRLIKLVEDAKKKYNIQTTDPDVQLKNALDTYKTRINNQIKDLEKQIRERKKIIRDKTSLQLDPEAKLLTIRRDQLKEVFNTVFGKAGLTLEQRIRIAERSLERSIATHEKKIKEGDISPITKKGKQVTSPRIEQLRAKKDVLSKELKILRDLAKPKKTAQEIALQTLKTRLSNEIGRIEDKLARMDFEPKAKREIILDGKVKQLKEDRDRVRNAYNAAKQVKDTVTREEVENIVRLASEASEAQKKVVKSGDWTADNAVEVEDFFYKKNDFEKYVGNIKPKTGGDIVNNFIDYFRASILASPRILRNSFLYQIVPGIERTITKRIVTGAFSDADLKSNIVEKFMAKLSGVKPSVKSLDFIKRQVAMAIRIYHRTGIDISRIDKMESTSRFFGERVGRITGKSIFAKIGRFVSLGPKWFAGGTDMLFANIGRADTALMMSKEIAKIESLKGKLPEGMTQEQRADQLLKESYSFEPKDKRADVIRDAGIKDAHMMNNTQPGWWSDKVIEFRRMLSIGKVNFGKAIIPFAKIVNVVVAEGFKTASSYGIAKSIYDINRAAKESNIEKRAKMMRDGVTDLVRYVGLTGAALLLASFIDDDDFIGAYDTLGRKKYALARARGAGSNYIRIGGKWIPLRYFPMLNIPIAGIMTARQAMQSKRDPIVGYLKGVMGQIMDAPGIKEVGEISSNIGYAIRADTLEKVAKSLDLDWESLSAWAKVRMIPSVISYDAWNALFPQDSKYDFMGREIQRGGVFKDDKSNAITLEFNRLSSKDQFPAISDPTGKYAVLLEERLGEEKYQEVLNKLKRDYAKEVSWKMGTSHYKSSSDEEKKKIINKIRAKKITREIKRKEEGAR